MVLSGDEEQCARLPRLFTYMRYNAELTRKGLDQLDLADVLPECVQKLDSGGIHWTTWRVSAEAVGRMHVRSTHFDGFVYANRGCWAPSWLASIWPEPGAGALYRYIGRPPCSASQPRTMRG